MLPDEGTSPLLDELAAALDREASPFLWTGRWRPAPRARLRFADGTTVALVPRSKAARERTLDELVARAHPAVFGEGNETKRDARVRNGLQIREAGLALEGVDLPAEGVIDAIGAILAPGDAGAVEAVLDAVNLYPVGGHFVRHKDTPRDPAVLGSLVVCLPFAFSGGELDVARAGDSATVDWASSSGDASGELSCAAFFSDVDHRVRAVTGGTRVTLTFALRRAVGGAARAERGDGEVALARLLEAVADEQRGGITLHVPCLHAYPVSADTPTSVRLAVGSAPLTSLKGRDAVVARAALAAGLDVSLVRALLIELDAYVEARRLYEPPTEKRIARLRKLCARVGADGVASAPIDEVATDDWSTRPSRHAYHFLGRLGPGATFLGAGLYSSNDYYGNEASSAYYYASGLLEIVAHPRPSDVEATVEHPKWGRGRVVAVSAEGGENKLRIRFESGEERVILERFMRK